MPVPDRLPPLQALRCFEAAARHLNFGKAADTLSITRSAVSHQIRKLEDEIGQPLFRRDGRSVHLTPAGEALLPAVRDGFDGIRDAARRLREGWPRSELTVQVYVSVAMRWLIPRLHGLHERAPKVSIRILTSVLDWAFEDAQADVGLVCQRTRRRRDLRYRRLFGALIYPVCSPELAERHAVRTPADLLALPVLEVYTATDEWRRWMDALGLASETVQVAERFDSYLLSMEAAAEGQGVAFCNGPFFASELASGRLVRPVPQTVPIDADWCLVHRRDLDGEPRVRELEAWFQRALSEDPLAHALMPEDDARRLTKDTAE
jgi:LysR family glycine cleavage system transcriptional activator